MCGSGIKHLEILHRPGKKNQPADALSRQPTLPAPVDDGTSEEAQIAHISSDDTTDISTLLQEDPNNVSSSDESFCELQLKDPALRLIMSYLSEGILPDDSQVAAKIIVQASLYTIINGLLYYVGQKSDNTPR